MNRSPEGPFRQAQGLEQSRETQGPERSR